MERGPFVPVATEPGRYRNGQVNSAGWQRRYCMARTASLSLVENKVVVDKRSVCDVARAAVAAWEGAARTRPNAR